RFWAFVNPIRQKWLHKKLDDAWASGVLSRIERKVTEMNAFHYNNLSERQFDALLNEGKELLAQLSSSVQLWQEDEALLEKVHNSYVMVLSLKLLGEKTSTDKNTLGSTSCSMKCIYERSISALVKGSPLPWDFDSIYTKIQALFNRADGSASATRPLIDFEKMVLEDVPLDSSLKLPRTCCLRLFGLPSQAEDEEIRSAYRRLCLQYHPDKNPDNPEHAKGMFLRVQIVASLLRF
ncbi:MAG: J domain-containing protein, partial [Vibrionaceae bacterium]